MRTIHKYEIGINDVVTLSLPIRAEILTVQVQRDMPCIWAMVESDRPLVSRRFAWRGTGHDCSDLLGETYVGTVQLNPGSLVFHLFDLGVAHAD